MSEIFAITRNLVEVLWSVLPEAMLRSVSVLLLEVRLMSVTHAASRKLC